MHILVLHILNYNRLHQAHSDGPLFYPVVTTISCGSHTLLDFYKRLETTEVDTAIYNKEDCYIIMHTLMRYILFLQQQQPKLEFSLLLERRSLLVLQKDLYHNYLHSISERDADSITESSIKNLHMCVEKFTEEETVKRGTRLSLTIRHVPKTSKLKLKIF